MGRNGEKTDDTPWVPLRSKDLAPDDMKRVRTVLDRIPELPVSVHQVIQMTSDPKASSKDIADIASSDPVLVSHILMMVNSSYYGISRKIDNLRLAIVLLGFDEVRSVAIRCGFSRVLKKFGTQTGYDASALWTHSYLVSVCAEWFAGDDDPQNAGTLLTLGLLHDIGKFALYFIGMLMKERGIRPASGDRMPPEAPLIEKEDRLFGVNHSIVGGLLSRRWNLSERISSTIEHHHHPSFFGMSEIPADYLHDVAVVCISDLIVNNREGAMTVSSLPHPRYFEMVGIEPDLDRAVIPELANKLDHARDFISSLV